MQELRSNYIFRFQEGLSELAVRLNAVGREINKANYSNNGMTRSDRGGPFLFQYTLSGLAMIRVGDRVYRLDTGKAFMIQFVGDYHYYMPEESDRYECMFISLQGEDVAKCWSHLNGEFGPILYLPDYSVPIRTLKFIHQEANMKKITDAYKASALGYQFMTELYRFSKGYDVQKKWPDIITEAAKVLQEQYDTIEGLDRLSERLGVTKHHLIKLFHRTVGKTPIEFLTRIRMEKAVELLRNHERSLDEISQKVGYSDVNYFIKVFRKSFGIPPGQFRKKYATDHVMFDI